VVPLKTDLRFPIPGQWGHGSRIIHEELSKKYVHLTSKEKIRKFLRKVGLLEKVRKIRGGEVTSNSFGMLYIINK